MRIDMQLLQRLASWAFRHRQRESRSGSLQAVIFFEESTRRACNDEHIAPGPEVFAAPVSETVAVFQHSEMMAHRARERTHPANARCVHFTSVGAREYSVVGYM